MFLALADELGRLLLQRGVAADVSASLLAAMSLGSVFR